jgi:maltose-binding protein MalE
LEEEQQPRSRGEKRMRRVVLAGLAAVLVGGAAETLHVASPLLSRLLSSNRASSFHRGPTPVPTAYVNVGLALMEVSATPTPPPRSPRGNLTLWQAIPNVGKELIAHGSIWKAFERATGIGVAAVSVVTTPQRDLTQVLAVAVAAGHPPEVVCVPRYYTGTLAWQGVVRDVSLLAQKDGVRAADFYQASWEESSFQGKLYGLPFGADARAIWTNGRFYSGERNPPFDPSRGPSSLSELVRAGTPRPSGDGFLFGYSPFAGEVLPYTWGIPFGARWYQPTGKAFTSVAGAELATLHWIQGFLKDGRPPQAWMALPPILTARVNVVVYSQALLADVGLDETTPGWVVSPLPRGQGRGAAAVWSSGCLLALPIGSVWEEAWKFVQHYTATEAMLTYLQSGGRRVMPAQQQMAQDPRVLQVSPYWPFFLKLLPEAWWLPAIPESSLAYHTLERAAFRGGSGALTAVMSEAISLLNEMLRQDGW